MSDIANLVFIAAKRWVTAIDGRTGEQIWQTAVPGSKWMNSGFMTLTVDPGGVYVSRTGTVSCLDPIDGKILWTFKPPGAGSLPVVATMMGGGSGGEQAAMIAAVQGQQAAAAAAAG